MRQEVISGWGGCPSIRANLQEIRSSQDISHALEGSSSLTLRGLGRSYGDSSLGNQVMITTQMDRLLSFNEKTGILECEAGVCLEDLIRVFVPKGWFVPVTPGTRFVTVGGMLASDVHGKNHHKSGSFSKHVLNFTLLDASGTVHEVDRERNLNLFLATAGGMGLTGMILKVRFQMIPIKSSWIRQKTIKIKHLDELLDQFERSDQTTYSVSWVDCMSSGKTLGRSLLMLGEHADPEELPNSLKENAVKLDLRQKLNVPFHLPSGILNSWSIKSFNSLYYHRIQNKENSEFVPLL
ncbi:MAG: FAD-binding oxidoreductase, partial [SAR324 cluster bacterium]|nr:FAD-binding oxidoreductase [SAR324 cluster bacterium]